MKVGSNAKLALLFSLAVLFLSLLYASEIVPALQKNLPLNVYLDYLDAKLTFGCNACYYGLQKCRSTNDTTYYWISEWYTETWGRDSIFDATGRQVCNVRLTFTECKYGCKERYAACPALQSCDAVLGNYFIDAVYLPHLP